MLRLTIIVMVFLASSLSSTLRSQPRIIEWSHLDSIINVPYDTTYIVNFWATWCKPCIKEIPYFEQIGKEHKDDNVKVYLVSLDFSEHAESKLAPYMSENNIEQEVLLLDDTDYDRWISKIDADWQGAIPATLIFNNTTGTQLFMQKEFSEPELRTLIKPLLK